MTDDGELRRLAEAGVVSISLQREATGAPATIGGNVVYNMSTFLRGDDSEGAVGPDRFDYFAG